MSRSFIWLRITTGALYQRHLEVPVYRITYLCVSDPHYKSEIDVTCAHQKVMSSGSYIFSVLCRLLPCFTFTSCELNTSNRPTCICIRSSHRERNTIVLASYKIVSFSSGGRLYFCIAMFITVTAQ